MFRFIEFLIMIVVAITLVKSVLGTISKVVGSFTMQGQPGAGGAASGARKPAAPTADELRKDPVCGTFVSTSTAFRKVAGGETHYFCSAECQAKFRG